MDTRGRQSVPWSGRPVRLLVRGTVRGPPSRRDPRSVKRQVLTPSNRIVKAWRRWIRSVAQRRRIRRNKTVDSRCHRCGLLGFYRYPDEARATIDDLLELPLGQRTMLEGMLANARAAGRIKGDEYDPRIDQNLGTVDWLYGGVKCGVGDHRGASTSWAVPGPRQSNREFMTMWANNGALVTEPDPGKPGILGRVRGVAQTFLWNLVRPHDCEHLMKHRPGLTPIQHVRLREQLGTRWLDRPLVKYALVPLLIAIVGGLIVAAILGAL